MKNLLHTWLLAAALLLPSLPASSIEMTAGNSSQSYNSAIVNSIESSMQETLTYVTDNMNLLIDQLTKIEICSAKAMFYAPANYTYGSPDADGCVFPPEPPHGTQEYTVGGTYSFTVPDRVNTISAQVVGGGGGAAWNNCYGNACYGGSGGGGAGGYSSADITVTPGSTLTIIVGSGGAWANKGATSSIDGTLIYATGGNPGAPAGSDAGGSGGTGFNGTVNNTGPSGTSGATGGKGIYAFGSGGAGWVMNYGAGKGGTAAAAAGSGGGIDGAVLLNW